MPIPPFSSAPGMSQPQGDARYVNVTGDTISGDLGINTQSVNEVRLGDGSALSIGDTFGGLSGKGVAAANSSPGCIVNHSASFTGLTEFSFSMWFTVSRVTTGSGRLIQKGNGENTTLFQIFRGAALGYTGLAYRLGTGSSLIAIAGTRPFSYYVNTGWHHIYFERDAAGNIRSYIDGSLDATGTISGSIPVNTSNLSIGDRGGDDAIVGQYDQFLFYNRVLTSTERTNLYNAGVGTYSGVPGSGNVCRLEFDSYLYTGSVTSNITVPDLSGNSNSASVNPQLAQFVPGKILSTSGSGVINSSFVQTDPPVVPGENAQVTIGNTANKLIIDAWETEVRSNTPVRFTQRSASGNMVEFFAIDGKLKNAVLNDGSWAAFHPTTTGNKAMMVGYDGSLREASIRLDASLGGGQASILFNCEFVRFSNGFQIPARIDGTGSCLLANSITKLWTEPGLYFHLYNFSSDSYNVPSTTRLYVAPNGTSTSHKAFVVRQQPSTTNPTLTEYQDSAGILPKAS
jgi:hypothetical protein